jgi:hypothetical protein
MLQEAKAAWGLKDGVAGKRKRKSPTQLKADGLKIPGKSDLINRKVWGN